MGASGVYAQESAQSGAAVDEEDFSPIENIGDEFQNSIKLLQNRFRVDHNVKELTMVFFRQYGSAPIVLVRPDGSKIFQTQVENSDSKDIFWYDSDSYDLIHIKNPVAGPWQAVGQIIPGSKVMVLSDIQLHADPLPPIIFSGEILKQTAYLTNGDKPIEFKQFRDVVALSIEFKSTNNPNYDNFGAGDELVATFEDNGQGMDEAPMDGTFTGQFNLSVPAGEWQPIFRVKTPMYTRELSSDLLLLYPTPIKMEVELSEKGKGYHTLLIDVERDLVDLHSLLVDGEVRFPNGESQSFSITDMSDKVREHEIVAYDYGIFRVKMTAYGKTVDGRDFIIDVPEYSFFAPEPEEGVVEEEAVPDLEASLMEEMPMEALPEEEPQDVVMLILLINGCIVVVGVSVIGVILFLRKRKRKAALAAAAPAADTVDGADALASVGFIGKLLGKFKKKKPEVEE